MLGFSGLPPRPRSDSASQFPTEGGSAPRRPLSASLPVPRAARPLRPRRPTYRARSPSHHLQQAPAASLRLGTLPASQALAGGHVTDGRRAPARVRTPAWPASASAAYPTARVRAAAGFPVVSSERAARLGAVWNSTWSTPSACPSLTVRVKLGSPAQWAVSNSQNCKSRPVLESQWQSAACDGNGKDRHRTPDCKHCNSHRCAECWTRARLSLGKILVWRDL